MSERDLVQELKANIVDLQSEKADMARTIETKERRIKQIMIKLEHATKDTQSVGHKISERNKQIVDLEAKLETKERLLEEALIKIKKLTDDTNTEDTELDQ
jgi:chromosome segregation ATPase|tara:strand:+ start:918 stop:1220 length:303 start_codon:yes stop_codon:yes gene_type:complete